MVNVDGEMICILVRGANKKNNDSITDSMCRRRGRTIVLDPLRRTIGNDLSNLQLDPPV